MPGLPENWQTIGAYLLRAGYTPIETAGILGNIEQESGGDPEAVGSSGGGLIGFWPTPPGYITGNPARDLQIQLAGIVRYNNEQGSLALARLRQARTPTEAAQIYMQLFERPAVSTENAANREQSAALVYKRMTKGGGVHLPGGNTAPNILGAITGNPGGIGTSTAQTLHGAQTNLTSDALRIAKGVGGVLLMLVGFWVVIRQSDAIQGAEAKAKSLAKNAGIAGEAAAGSGDKTKNGAKSEGGTAEAGTAEAGTADVAAVAA